MKPEGSLLMGKLLWRKRVCVCARVRAHVCTLGWGSQGRGREERKEKTKQEKTA